MTYRAEVVGSLLRPSYLMDARKRHEVGELAASEFKAIEDQAVREPVALGLAADKRMVRCNTA